MGLAVSAGDEVSCVSTFSVSTISVRPLDTLLSNPVRRAAFVLLNAWICLALACTSSASPDEPAVWGSEQASLTVQNGSSRLLIFNSGSCYGDYGDIAQRIPSHQFDLTGTFTQIINVPPGQLHYSAEFTGTVTGNELAITVNVPSLQQVFGPYVLVQGVTNEKGQCLYP